MESQQQDVLFRAKAAEPGVEQWRAGKIEAQRADLREAAREIVRRGAVDQRKIERCGGVDRLRLGGDVDGRAQGLVARDERLQGGAQFREVERAAQFERGGFIGSARGIGNRRREQAESALRLEQWQRDAGGSALANL